MTAPLVSVVVPSYNHAPFLERRMASVLGQSLADLEVILLDDASTDGSRAICERFAAGDARVRFFANDANSGSPFVQWNRGVREARGAYVWIAESDDDADPRLLATLVDRLERTPGAVVACAGSLVVDAEDRRLGAWSDELARFDPSRWTRDFVASGREECARFLVRENTLPNASGVVFRRSAWHAAGGADESLRIAGDWKLWATMLLEGDLAFVAEPLNRFRRHAQTVRGTLRASRQFEEAVAVTSWLAGRLGLRGRDLDAYRAHLAARVLHFAATTRSAPAALRAARVALGAPGMGWSAGATRAFAAEVAAAARRHG